MDIFDKFQAGQMFNFARWHDRCHLGPVPTIEQAFNVDPGKTIQLLDSYTTYALRYMIAREKPSNEQIRMMSLVIISTWPRLKLTQLMLFWVQLLSGKYGKLYNCIDPLDISTRLTKFVQGECRDMYTQGRDMATWETWQPPTEECTLININTKTS